MISIVQNFICTKPERLEVLEKSVESFTNTFSDSNFYINYNSTINLDSVHNIYTKYVKPTQLHFYNDLTEDWALVTASLLNNVTTPYTIAVCEDMVVKGTKEKVDNCIREFIRNDFDYMLISKIHKYLQQQYIDGYTPYNTNKSPGYKKMKDGYFYLGKHAPHKRVSYDAMYKTDWYRERVIEFIQNKHTCTHDIPIRDIRKPNYYEGYYDFNNGMSRFEDMKCYIPDEPIILEVEIVKQNR